MFSWNVLHDVRMALRGLLKTPGLTFVVVLTLAVAIGANTAIFSVVESVLLKPLPYPNEDRIVRVAATLKAGSGDRGNVFSDRGYWLFANNNRSFEKFGGYWDNWLPLTGEGPARRVLVGLMTLSAFEVLGILPELGRLPTAEEDTPGGPAVVLLSHDLWVSRYGADTSILGRTVELNGTPREVIGIMPAGYDFPTYPYPTPGYDLWTPLQLDPASADFADHYLSAVARLAPGVTIEAAIGDARNLVARFDEAGYEPRWFGEEGIYDGGAVVRPLHDYIVERAQQPLLIVFGTLGFVLLIACSNVANLLLVRAQGRRRENAIRIALGSGRGRLARHVLIESLLLAITGGIAGVALANAGTGALVAIGSAAGIPQLDEIEVSGAALAFTAGVSLLAGVLFGVLPALTSSSTRAMGALRDGGHGSTLGRERHRARNALVTTQIALAFVLVIGAGLMARSLGALRSVDPGFSADGVLTFTVLPLETKYGDSEAAAQLYDRLIERLAAVPGVTRAAAINSLPMRYSCCNSGGVVEEFPPAEGELPPRFRVNRSTPGYFEVMSIPLVEGRTFTSEDHEHRLGSAIISRSVKDTYWPDVSALGKRITVQGVQAQVVGVVGDVHVIALDVPAAQSVYLPMLDAEGSNPRAMPLSAMTMTIRTAVEPLSLVSTIRGAIAELDPDLPMEDVLAMPTVLGDSVSDTSFMASVLTIAALVALFLGSVGIYGVLSYVVTQRTPEIGIRTALGATPEVVRRMILSQGLWLAGAGVLIGLVGAVALGQVLATQLYGVSPVDPLTIAVAAAIFVGVAMLASFLPAARAAGTSPLDALRAG